MKKKIICIGIISMFLLTGFISATVLGMNTTGNIKTTSLVLFYVDDDWTCQEDVDKFDNSGFLTWGSNAFNTIQNAIDYTSDGANYNIYVCDGVYNENIIVDVNGIHIGQYGLGVAIIDGNEKGDVVTITADYVSFKGFTIRNAGVENDGVVINGVENRIWLNNIMNCYRGIFISKEYNEISSNDIENNLYGIISNNNGDIEISSNEIFNNDYTGIVIEKGELVNIDDNRVYQNLNGIKISSDSERTTIQDNTISLNFEAGIILDHSSNNMIYRNNFYKNEKNALITEGCENNYWWWEYETMKEGNYWSDYDKEHAIPNRNRITWYKPPYKIISDGENPVVMDVDLFPWINPDGEPEGSKSVTHPKLKIILLKLFEEFPLIQQFFKL